MAIDAAGQNTRHRGASRLTAIVDSGASYYPRTRALSRARFNIVSCQASQSLTINADLILLHGH